MFLSRIDHVIAFYCILGILCTFNKSWETQNICPSELYGEVYWPSTKNFDCVQSDPYCLSENMKIERRCCDSDGNWESIPICTFYQNAITNPCPDNFDWKSNICMFVIENTSYPPPCPYEEKVPFSDYISLVDSLLLPVWMPVERIIKEYGIDLFRWTEPNSNYKKPYALCNEEICVDYYYEEYIKDKNCLIYYNSTFVKAISCDEKHTAICAYQSLPEKLHSFCSKSFPQSEFCIQSNYSSYSKCFCQGILENHPAAPRVEFHEPYQNLLYSSLDGMCYIGLQNLNGSYVWRHSNTSIKYSNWAENAILDDNYIYGTITSDGWIMTTAENETDCVLYETEVVVKGGELILDYAEEQFVLTLTHPSSWIHQSNGTLPLVLCFTDAASSDIITEIDITNSKKLPDQIQFYFKEHKDGPGNYWCEAFLYPGVSVKTSNKYLLRYSDSYTKEYVILLKTRYTKGVNPITKSNLEVYQKILADEISLLPVVSDYQVRIFKIIEIDETNLELTINFHLVYPDYSADLKDYSTIRDHMEHSLVNFTFVNIFTVDHCIGMQDANQIIWPTTLINTVTNPRNLFCIRSDGSIFGRRCSGDYINGAYWMDLEESCAKVQQSTNATVNLTYIIELNDPKEYMQQVVDISKNYLELQAEDVAKISNFLEQVAHSEHIKLDLVRQIVSSLMEVPKEILKLSESLFMATDRILHNLHNIIDKSEFEGDLVDGNVFITSANINECNLSAIIVREFGEANYILDKVYNSLKLSDIVEMPDLKVAIILSEGLKLKLQDINFPKKIMVTIFKKSSLFIDIAHKEERNTEFVIGVSFSSVPIITGEIITVYNIPENEENDSRCFSWNMESEIKYWIDANTNFSESSVICTYDRQMYFTVIRNGGINITYELESIINSEINVEEKLSEAYTLLTNYYKYIQSIDLQLISQLLYTVANENEPNLELVCDLINIITDIPKTVLKQSYDLDNTTSKILIYFEQILQKSSFSQIIRKGNMFIIIHLLREEPIYGFTINHCNEECNVNIFRHKLTDISLIEELDIALSISDELLNQLLEYDTKDYVPKIVITIFFKDSLFIQDYEQPKIITKVVGVSFPNFYESPFKGDISMFYNVKLLITLNYTCSIYQIDDDNGNIGNGFWNSANPSVLNNGLQYCNFWESKYFGLTYNSVNLTSDLEKLFNSDDDIEMILYKTITIISNFYEYLQPIDVSIIAELLSKINYVNAIILDSCLNIINDIMNISSNILQISNDQYNATNILLHEFNRIVVSFGKPKEIYSNNIALIISLLDETGMCGVSLENCSTYCDVNILYSEGNSLQNALLRKSNCELKLSPNLINNLLVAKSDSYTPILVLTIFYKNVLFVDNEYSKNISQVFGVHFPNYNQILANEIEITIPRLNKNPYNYTCVSWDYKNNDTNKGYWSYKGQPRNNENIQCNFYEQNYYAVIEGEVFFDTTRLLELIVNLEEDIEMSYREKLYRAQDISYYYQEFQPYDIYLFSLILNLPTDIYERELDMVNVIINNLLKTPEEILNNVKVEGNALKKILRSIKQIANVKDSQQYSLLNDQFGLAICQLKSDSSNGIIITLNDIQCTYDIEDSNYAENIEAGLILSKEIIDQTVQENNAMFIVSVFYNNIFFDFEGKQNTSLVLGLHLLNIKENVKGNILVFFNDSNYNKLNNNCGYWKNLEEWEVKDGEFENLFQKCIYTESTYYTLLENNNNIINVTKMLTDIIDANQTILNKLLQTLKIITGYPEQFTPNHVFLISKILSIVKEVDSACLRVIVNITNSIVNLPRKVLAASQIEYGATDCLLHHVGRIAQQVEHSANIFSENVALLISKNISGILIKEDKNRKYVEVIFNDINLTSVKEISNINAALVLDDKLRENIQINSSSQVVATVYFSDALFNECDERIYKHVSPIIGIVVPEEMSGSVQFYYHTTNAYEDLCAFWNYTMKEDTVMKGHWEKNKASFQPLTQISICESKQSTHFARLKTERNVTNSLENILATESTVQEKLDEVANIINDIVGKLLPVDIYLISQILELALENVDVSKMNTTSHIISSMFNVPRNVLRKSQLTYYATDKILYTIDEMVKGLKPTDVESIIRDNFTITAYDLKETNISGLVLENCNTTQCNISVVKGTVNLTELIKNNNIQTAIAMSEELVQQVRQSEGSPKLVVVVYFSDVFFNEQIERQDKVSMISGVLLPELNTTFLGSLYVIFKNADNIDYNSSCAFWNFQVKDGKEILQGSWKSEVDSQNNEDFTICEYDHITHFALLLAKDNSSFADANKYKILDIITAVDSILSLVGLFGILLTAALFERWRRNTGNQILVHFSIAISIKIVMLYVSVEVYSKEPLDIACSVTGAILHYAMLSEFCWMLIIAILQFKRFVEVLGGPPKYVLLKACICGWIFPLLPVTLILLIDRENYSASQVGLCYPSGLGLYLGIWLPIIIIVTINFVIFIFIIYNVFHKKTETRDLVNHEILFQWRLALLLFSMLGLTWLFGFLAQIPGVGNMFLYIFCILATLQGFIMFLFFIVFNKSTRFLYSQAIKLWLFSRGYKMH